MRVDIWSDVVCPWCYLGKRRFERALSQFDHRDGVEVVWRSFQLDPAFPRGAAEPVPAALARKTGASPAQIRAMQGHVTALAAEEGLAYHLDRSIMVNTFDAHRLTHLAARHGLGGQTHERLLRANLIEGKTLDDPETLVQLGAEVGVPAEETRRMLDGDAHAAEVEQDIRRARQAGVTGVPFFMFDRAHGVPGAQPLDVFRDALRRAFAGVR